MSPTKPYTRAQLRKEMQFSVVLPPGVVLYCNDAYQYGLRVEDQFNYGTRNNGLLASGILDPYYGAVIVDLPENDQEGVIIAVRCNGGRNLHNSLNRYWIDIALFSKCFEFLK